MKDIRIGNDISVRWSLYKGDEAYDLTNLPVTLYLKNAYGKKEIKDYTIEGNQISWTFFGKDQKNTGKYSMVLVIREGERGMASTDYCDFVQLVSCACQVSGMDEENVQTETVELTSEVDFPPIIVDTALSESSLNPIANKAVAEKFAEVEGKMALQPDWNQSDPISKDYIKNRTHGIVFHEDPRKSNYNDFLKSLTNPMIMHVGGNTIATFHTGYHSLYDYDTFLFQLSWYSTTDNILDGIIPTNQSVSVGASTSVVLTFRTFGSVTEDGEFVEHYQTTISFNDSEGLNVDEVISALCEQYCLLINEDFEIAKLDEKYIPGTIARQEDVESKVDKVEGKGLSTNDYTTAEKNKLAGLQNYDDAEVRGKLAELSQRTEFILQDGFYGGEPTSTTLRYIQDNTLSCIKIVCTEGDSFILSGRGSNNANVWYTLGADEKIVRRGGADQLTDFKVTIQDGEKYLVFNSWKSANPSIAILSLADALLKVKENDTILKNEIEELRVTELPVEFLNTHMILLIETGELTGGTVNSKYTDYINLDGIKYFRIKTTILTSKVAMAAFYDEDKNFISAIAASNVDTKIDNFPAGAKFIRLSINGTDTNSYALKSYKEEYLSKGISELMELLQFEGPKEILLNKNIENAFINLNGGVENIEGYNISQEIQVRKGDVLKIESSCTYRMTQLAKKISDNEYEPLISGPSSVYRIAVFYVKETCNVVLSFANPVTATPKLSVWHSETLSQLLSGLGNGTISGNDGADIQESEEVYDISFSGNVWKSIVDFTIDTNVNETKDNIVLAQFEDTKVSLVSKNTEPLISKYSNDDESYVQEIKFNSGYQIGETFLNMEAKKWKPIVGVPSMMIWLKGFVAESEPNQEEVSARAAWLEENQDYSLVVENGTLSIVRDGIGYDGTLFNNGETSTIFSTSLTAKPLSELYSELSALDFLYVEMMDLSANKTCEDLLQFGKVKLVGRYNQQLDRTSSVKTYAFDSYPFPLRFTKDESLHTLEIVCNGSNTFCCIDGRTIKIDAITTSLQIFKKSGITIKSLRAESTNDGVIFSGQDIVSPDSPRLLGLMGHTTKDTYEGDVPADGVSKSVTRLEDVCLELQNKGYNVMSLDELVKAMQSLRRMPPRSCFFIFDDMQISNLYKNYKIRSHVSRYGYPMNFAIIQDYPSFEEVKNLVLPMRLNGWCCASHSLKHDVPLPNKNSIIFRWELDEIRRKCDEQYMIPNIIVYNWSGSWEPLYNMLQMCGYVAGVNSGGTDSRIATNPYNLGRINIADEVAFNSIKAAIL